MPAETEMLMTQLSEEEALMRKRQELALLLAQLADREITLVSLNSELAAFEGLYLREVGLLYAELDDWNARIAELIAEKDGSPQAARAATEARRQANESRAAANSEVAKTPAFVASRELRSLYREIVKSVHPDRAVGEADRFLRERLMKRASDAYARGDADALQEIIEEYRNSPEAVQGVGVSADLLRIVRQIELTTKRLLVSRKIKT